MANDVAFFDAFYEENKNKLEMPPEESYPLDRLALAAWSKELPAKQDYLRMMAQVITMGVEHVGFANFYERLQLGAMEIVQESRRIEKPIVLVITERYNKSNLWCALLVWPLLKDRVTRIVKVVTKLDDKEIMDDAPSGVIYVHVDDATYSGMQVTSFMRYIPSVYDGKSSYYVLAAAVSNDAKAMIKKAMPPAKFTSRTINFKSLQEHAMDIFEPEEVEYMFNKLVAYPYSDIYQFFKRVHMLYFDHKLPDGVSTIQKILAVAPVLDLETGEISLRSLIKGCNVDDYKVNNKPMDEDSAREFVTDYDATGTCPRAFYKSIPYTYQGRPLSELNKRPMHILDYNKKREKLRQCVDCDRSTLKCSICQTKVCEKCFKKNH